MQGAIKCCTFAAFEVNVLKPFQATKQPGKANENANESASSNASADGSNYANQSECNVQPNAACLVQMQWMCIGWLCQTDTNILR